MHQIRKKSLPAQISLLKGLLLTGALVACTPQGDSASPLSAALADPGCGKNGALEAAFFGGIEAKIQWAANEMECESMQRPNGEGIRMRFAGEVSGEHLAIIVAMPGLKLDEIGVEMPSNVTATVEGTGRFFNTPNLDVCWTEVHSQARLAELADSRAIKGTLFCIAPLGEINGSAAVSIPKLTFSTIVDWSSK